MSSGAPFLRKEYEAAYREDVHSGYVQDGTSEFTAREPLLECYDPWNDCELKMADGQEVSLSTVVIDEYCERIFLPRLEEFLSLTTQEMSDSRGALWISRARTAHTLPNCFSTFRS